MLFSTSHDYFVITDLYLLPLPIALSPHPQSDNHQNVFYEPVSVFIYLILWFPYINEII